MPVRLVTWSKPEVPGALCGECGIEGLQEGVLDNGGKGSSISASSYTIANACEGRMTAKKETIEEPTQPLTVSTAKMVNHACHPPPSAPPSPHRGTRMRVSAVAASVSTHASRIACGGSKTGVGGPCVAQFPPDRQLPREGVR